MRNAGAAKRREQEPPRGGGPIEADLLRVIAGSADIAARLGRHDQAITGIIAKLEQMAAECPDAGYLAAAADRLRTRHEQVTIELISLAAHNAEAREAAENLASVLGTQAMMTDAWIAEGRRREAAERDAQPRPRAAGAHRKRHLKPVPGMTSTAVRAAVAAGVTAMTVTGGIAAMHEESSVRTVASAPAAARGVHQMPPDTAVEVPQARSFPSPRPSAAAASARPAPAVTRSPSTPASAPARAPSVTPAAVPALSVARFLDLGASIRGLLTLTAGPQAVTWTATTTDGITLSQSGGVLVPGQAVTLEVTDPTGGSGWIYVSFGGTTVPVHVTSGLGAPLGL